MKSTGIVRKVDELGRLVLPIELRRTLGIAEKDAMEIFVDEDKIILRKYETDVDKENIKNQLTALLDKTADDSDKEAIQRAISFIK